MDWSPCFGEWRKVDSTRGGKRNGGGWTFFSNPTYALVFLCWDPGARALDAAKTVTITERSGHQIDKMISGKSVER